MLGSIRARLGLGVLVVLVLASLGTVARGGSPRYAWAATAGSVPTGLTLDAWGHLTGTPTVAGTYTFTVTATDTVGQTATHSYTIAIS